MIDWRLSCNSYNGESFLEVIRKTEKQTKDYLEQFYSQNIGDTQNG